MVKKLGKWFMALSRLGKVGVVVATLFVLGLAGSSSSNDQKSSTFTVDQKSSLNQPPEQSVSPAKKVQEDQVEHKTETKKEEIQFTINRVSDSSLAEGKTKLKTAGQNGVRTITYDVTYTNGEETARTQTGSIITTEPVDEVLLVGTYVAPKLSCPNGTYVNSSGNTVCRPYATSSAPAGATAKCRDGTYSFSQHRSGTCSHHGGVASWL